MKVGDILVVVCNSTKDGVFPEIKIGQKFIANSFKTCCGFEGVDIGLRLLKPATVQTCNFCGKKHPVKGVAYYSKTYFRVLEPEYRTVEIAKEVRELELTQN